MLENNDNDIPERGRVESLLRPPLIPPLLTTTTTTTNGAVIKGSRDLDGATMNRACDLDSATSTKHATSTARQ